MANQGNNGAVQFVQAIQNISEKQIPRECIADFGTIKADYSTLRRPVATEEESGLQPGNRVLVVWVGNEAVVLGSIVKM